MSCVTAIGTSTPEFRFSQTTIASFMEKMMGDDPTVSRKIRTVFRASGISHRYSVLSDYGKTSGFLFFPESKNEPFPDTKRRMTVYRDNALPLSLAAVNDMLNTRSDFDLTSITHLIVVSCTGMYAPGLDIDLIKSLALSTSVERTCIQFMGCYAAFNALKVANSFCTANKDAKVLIVCTELCSIHFQREPTEDNILSNALFGDGSCAMLVEGTTSASKKLKIDRFHNEIAFAGEGHMSWEIGSTGFEMRLSSYVPDLIKSEIKSLLAGLQTKLFGHQTISHYALHPGGKKILETLEKELGISQEATAAAHFVLQEYGNLSSATVVFVLQRLFEKFTPANNGEFVLALGFGPGLTLESMVFEIEA